MYRSCLNINIKIIHALFCHLSLWSSKKVMKNNNNNNNNKNRFLTCMSQLLANYHPHSALRRMLNQAGAAQDS